MARLLQRGATIVVATTAVVLGGSGLALGATIHDVTTSGLAPTPRPQVAPVPSLVTAGHTLRPVVTHVVTTVTSTVHSLAPAPDGPPAAAPPPAAAQPPATEQANDKPQVVHPGRPTASGPRSGARAAHARTAGAGRALAQSGRVALEPASDQAFGQQPEQSVTPQLAPQAQPTTPTTGLPEPLRHELPTLLVIIAAAMLAALGAGHLGAWWAARS